MTFNPILVLFIVYLTLLLILINTSNLRYRLLIQILLFGITITQVIICVLHRDLIATLFFLFSAIPWIINIRLTIKLLNKTY